MLQDILDEAVDLHLGILGLREIQSSKFMRVFKGLLTSNWALGFPKYTTGFQSHALVFIIFSGCATLEWKIAERTLSEANERLGLSRTEAGPFVRNRPTRIGCNLTRKIIGPPPDVLPV